MSTAPLPATWLQMVCPLPDTPLFPLERARPGASAADLPRFADDRWDLAAMEHGESGFGLSHHWGLVEQPLREGVKRAAWALINIPAPDALTQKITSTARSRLAPATLKNIFKAWKLFARWLSAHQVTTLCEVTVELLAQYADVLRDKDVCHPAKRNEAFELTRLWAYSPFLMPCDRLVRPPWEEPGASVADFLGPANDARVSGENATVPIHPAVMSPLLVWALRTVTDLAPDVLAAWRVFHDWNRQLAPEPVPGGRDAIRDYLGGLRAGGQVLPTYVGR
ncbi:hypothetical protein ACWGCP_15390, partial [Streptomyces niveus]